ncbi:MAG: PHP domain-containing protein, partial [Bacteroidota bacterium]
METLLQWAQSVGVTSLALTDINNTSACLEFIRQCPEYGIRPVVGIDFRNGLQQQYIGLARNNEGFRELNAHLSYHLHTEEPLPDRAPAFAHATVIYPFERAPETPLRANEYLGIRPDQLNRLRFSSWRYQPDKLVLLQPLSFAGKADFNAHRLLRAIHHNTLLSKLPVSEQALPGETLISPDALRLRLQEYPELIRNTEALLAECTIAFTYGTSKNKTAFTRSPE